MFAVIAMKWFSLVVAICIFAELKLAKAINEPATTDSSPSPKLINYNKLSNRQQNGIVTIEFSTDDNSTSVDYVYEKLPPSVVSILNKSPSTDAGEPEPEVTTLPAKTDLEALIRRRRSTGEDEARYSEDGVQLVEVNPASKDDQLRVSLYAADKDGNVVPAGDLKEKLNSNKDDLSAEVGLPVGSIYEDLPPDVDAELQPRPTIWELHMTMFVVVGVLLVVAIVVLLICFLCFWCCKRKRSSQPSAKQEVKQPLPVDEMVELTPVVPLQYAAPPPAVTTPSPAAADDHGGPDDENGWIVPIDQLDFDYQPTDNQISKL